ncbi:MAG: DUF4908 domain-containing protein [Alphaproteobacteria bacterium]|nr:DUF4908 domain-containing protein [Alphaproteobacteria bacterium]MBL7096452.1 DUF4908 domain-containing protein [Alphaproteobacteria bacterium]
MPKSGIIFILAALFLGAAAVAGRAQESLGARLMMDRVGDIQTGSYTAGDNVRFALTRYAENYLLRLDGDPEVYVLYAGPGSLGGRTLKFDSGGTAIAISGWGGMTIYTDAQPGGLPTDRTGEALLPVLPPVPLTAVEEAARDEGNHIAYVRGIKLTFVADWPALAADAALRALTFDAIQNTARGIDRFTANARARAAIAAKMDTVQMVSGGRPTIALHGKTLVVTFVPEHGFAGRASSHGIARALGQMLSIPTPG